MRKVFFGITVILVTTIQITFGALKYSATSYVLYPQITNSGGGKKVSSNNLTLIKTIGQPVVGLGVTSNRKNFFGFIAYFIKVILGKMSFYDEYPTLTDELQITDVECKITLESYSAVELNTSSIKYRISNSGIQEEKFSLWRSGAVVETVFSNKKVRFKVSLPNSFNDKFSEGNNNYIQWYCEDKAQNKIISAKYRIKVLENDAPTISILQPRDNDIVSINPVIEAFVTDERWGVDPSSITIKIENSNKDIVLLLNSVSDNIWDNENGKIYYFARNLNLVDKQNYTLTIKVSDRNGKTSVVSSTFYVKSGQLADVVPYPSPFDPGKQPVAIRYVLATESEVTINIYNQSGMLVKNLIDKQYKTAGVQEDKWLGENFSGLGLASGIYFCEIIVKNNFGQYKHYIPLAVFRR